MSYLSKSKINTFISCPRKFYYQYIEKIQTSNEFAEIGIDIHSIAEEFLKLNKFGSREDILNVLLNSSTYKEEYREHCDNLATFFYDMLVEREYSVFSAEEKLVSYRYKFTGLADLVLEDKQGNLIIIDYKTGKSSTAKHYKLELCYYKMLVEEKFKGKKVSHVGIFFTKDGFLCLLEFSEDKEKFSREDVCSIYDYYLACNFIKTVRIEIEDYTENNNFPPRRQHLCNYCGYIGECGKDSGFEEV